MKRSRLILPVLLFLVLLTGCGADGIYHLTVITEGKHEPTQDIQGDVLIFGGEVLLDKDITVAHNIHLLLGRLTINGVVLGDVNFLNGDLTLGNTANIRGDLNLGGGSYHPSPATVIEGKINTGGGFRLPDIPEQRNSMGFSFWLRALATGLLFGLIAAALARYFPGGIGRIREAISKHSLACAAVGILAGIIGISLFVTMAYTILLIPVSLLGLFVLGAGVFLGWVGLGSELGMFLSRLINRPIKFTQASFFGMLILTLGLEIIASIPTLGSILSLALLTMGLGAAMLTRFGLRRFVPAIED